MTPLLAELLVHHERAEIERLVTCNVGADFNAWPADVRDAIERGEGIFRSRHGAIAVSAIMHACVFAHGEWRCYRKIYFQCLETIETALSGPDSADLAGDGSPRADPSPALAIAGQRLPSLNALRAAVQP